MSGETIAWSNVQDPTSWDVSHVFVMDRNELSDAAHQDPRQASYEIMRRAFQAEQGRVIKRMTGGKW